MTIVRAAAAVVLMLWNSKNPLHVQLLPRELPPAAAALGVQLQLLDVMGPEGLAPAIEAASRELRADQLIE
jgi:hypothetical protein